MDYKRKADEIRVCIILIKDKSVSKTLRIRKLNEMADLSEMFLFSDELKKEFVKESLRLQRFNKQVEWIRYYKDILLQLEMYEILSFLEDILK